MTDSWLTVLVAVLVATALTVLAIKLPPLFFVWRWLRYWLWLRPRAILLRESVWVDCTRGDDDAPGTRTAPIRTLAELHRRTTDRSFRGDFRVYLTGNFDGGDPLCLSAEARSGAVVLIRGVSATRDGRRRQAAKRWLYRLAPRLGHWRFRNRVLQEREEYFQDNPSVVLECVNISRGKK